MGIETPDLLTQHIAEQTVALIEARDRLNAFVESVPEAIAATETFLKKQRDELPDVANREMKRAGAEVINGLAQKVSDLSNQIAGDAAAAEKNRTETEKYKYKTRQITVLTAVVVGSAIIFGATGYILKMSIDNIELSTALERANAAELNLAKVVGDTKSNLEKVADAAEEKRSVSFDDLKKNYVAELDKIKRKNEWASSADGLLAKKFFDLGGAAAATCTSPTWDIENIKKVKWCIPQRPDFFGKNDRYGWKIP